MQKIEFSFSMFNKFIEDGVFQSLVELNKGNKQPLFICIGSDLVLGDSLGPLIGTFLRSKLKTNYIYGTLNYPITAKEVQYADDYLRKMHPNSFIVAIDAAVGEADEVGLIKVTNSGIKPGLGVNKDLGIVGDVGIIGIVAGRSLQNYNLFNLTRLNLIYQMAENISNAITQYCNYYEQNNEKITYGA